MDVRLSSGEIVRCNNDPEHSGAEGDVYFSLDGKSIIKLYHIAEINRQQSLDGIINRYNAVKDDPYWREYFCWPDGVVVSPKQGVRMPRAQEGLRNLDWFLLPKARSTLSPEEIGSWSGHLRIAIRLSRAMRRLHFLGLCHSDLSRKNCLVNAVTGDLKLIDLDGLVVPGILPARVSGTPEFIAPEIITSFAKPSIYTDLHSLAVLIYQILLFRHPLKGPKVHSKNPEEDDRLAFGERALFIEHPTDKSNRPTKHFVDSQILGPTLSNMMQQAFIKGLRSPNERPQSAEWESALVRLNDKIIPCVNPKCPGKYFPYIDKKQPMCPWCNTPWKLFSSIAMLELYRPVSGRVGQYIPDDFTIIAYPEKKVYEWHTYPDRPPGPKSEITPKAEFIYDAKKNLWWMKNIGEEKLKVLRENSGGIEITNGQQFCLEPGMRILLAEGPLARLAWVRINNLA